MYLPEGVSYTRVIANQFGNGVIVIISLPHLYPPSPFGRGDLRELRLHPLIWEIKIPTYILPLPKGGGGLRRGRVYFLFRYRIDWIVHIK